MGTQSINSSGRNLRERVTISGQQRCRQFLKRMRMPLVANVFLRLAERLRPQIGQCGLRQPNFAIPPFPQLYLAEVAPGSLAAIAAAVS